jgi:hypothetical protein
MFNLNSKDASKDRQNGYSACRSRIGFIANPIVVAKYIGSVSARRSTVTFWGLVKENLNFITFRSSLTSCCTLFHYRVIRQNGTQNVIYINYYHSCMNCETLPVIEIDANPDHVINSVMVKCEFGVCTKPVNAMAWLYINDGQENRAF